MYYVFFLEWPDTGKLSCYNELPFSIEFLFHEIVEVCILSPNVLSVSMGVTKNIAISKVMLVRDVVFMEAKNQPLAQLERVWQTIVHMSANYLKRQTINTKKAVVSPTIETWHVQKQKSRKSLRYQSLSLQRASAD